MCSRAGCEGASSSTSISNRCDSVCGTPKQPRERGYVSTPDLNDAARQAVMTGLAAGPLPAKFVSFVVGVLWPPSGDDVWGSIRARVEALINQKIADDVYHRVKLSLAGLKLV